MKRFTSFKKTLAVLLSALVLLSSFSILTASAADISAVSTSTAGDATPDEAVANIRQTKKNAQLIEVGAAAAETTGAATGYNVNSSSSWKLWWNKKLEYTNAVTGKKETFYANQYVTYHTVNKKGSNTKTTVWCIQPYLCIYNDGNYFLIGEGADKSYYNALKKKEDIKNAIAATIAFGKPMEANKNGAYYFAVQLISWEYKFGMRNPTTFKLKDEKESTLNYVTCETNAKKAELKKAYNYLEDMLQTYKDMPNSDKLYTTISKASKAADDNKIVLDDPNSKGEYIGSQKLKGLSKFDDLTYTVVNQNDNKTTKDIKVSVKGNSLTVTTKENLDPAKTSYQYFVRISRDIKVTNSKKDSVLQNKDANSQTLASRLKFSAESPIRYIAIIYTPAPTTKLKIHKDITTTSGETYDGDYSGWYFQYKNTTTGDSKILVTDADGVTSTVKEIPLNSKVEVTELGRKLTASDDKTKFKNITTVSGNNYGIPSTFTNKTAKWSKTITKSETVTVSWENTYDEPFPVRLKKQVDDNTTVEGYYFLVYTVGHPDKPVIEKPTIVGPTDADGELNFELDNANTGVIGVIELGFLKSGATYNKYPSISDIQSGSFRNNFNFPVRYNVQKGYIAITGIDDAVPYDISKSDLRKGYKEIEFENTTSGMLKLHKSDSVTKKPVANAVYGIFNYMQSSVDDTDYSSSGSSEDIGDTSSGEDDLEGDSDAEGDTDSDLPENLVCTLTTDENGDALSKLIPIGEYYVQEISVDSTYALDTTQYKIKILPGQNTELNAAKLNVEDKPSSVIFNKKESSALDSNGKQLAGCVIQFFEKPASGKIDYNTAKPVHEFTTTDSPEKVIGVLKVNKTYIAHEKSCPAGFCLADDVEFTVKSDGSDTTVTMTDKSTKIQAIKLDKSTNSYMADIRLQIQDSAGKPVKVRDYDGNLVESWITTTSPLTIEGILEAGKPYKLVELETKPGYTLADPVPFTVKGDGELQKITVENEPTRFKLSKKDITGTNEIPGCIIDLKEKGASTTLLTWTSGTEPKYIEGLLEVGKTYVMTERKPADGYVTATSIEFTVLNNGSVQTVTMKDDTTKVKVLKLDSSTKNNLAGALMQVQDLNGKPIKIKDYDGKLVESWRTRSTPLTIEGILAVNTTYQLVELEAPAGYVVAPPKKFTVEDKETVQTVTMYDDTTKVEFRKLAGDTNKQLSDCVMQLTDSKGKLIKRFTTTDKAYYLEGVLIAGETYTLTEVTAREGYMKAEPITFKVGTDGKKQVVTMTDLKYSAPDLPKTGGDSAFPFTAVGAACFIGAAITLIVRLKLKKSKN